MIFITIPGKPVSKLRARFSSGRVYTPEKTKKQESLIKNSVYIYMIEKKIKLIENPVSLSVIFSFKSKKSDSKYYYSKPDIDNLIKLVLDALNGIVFRDDSQVVCISSKKIIDISEYTKIEIEEIGE